MKLSEIAKIIGAEFNGTEKEITGINSLQDATENEISFVVSAKYTKEIQNTKAGAIIVESSLLEHVPSTTTALVVGFANWEMAVLSEHFAPAIEDDTLPEPLVGENTTISLKAEVAHGAKIGKNCTILAHAYIGANVEIGDNTIIYPNVTIYRDAKIGNNCIIHANSVIASDGFGFVTNKQGVHKKIYQNGNVVIEDDVEIGSNTSIDRAVFGTTLIKKGAKIDNLVQVGHNCELGEGVLLVSQVGLSGSSILGQNVVMGGQSATAGHLSIAPFNIMAARSGVTKSINVTGKTFAGFPLMEHKLWLKLQAKLARLIK